MQLVDISSLRAVEFDVKEKVLNLVGNVVEREKFETWIRHLDFLSDSKNNYIIPISNVFIKDLYEKKYLDVIRDAIRKITGKDVDVKFIEKAIIYENGKSCNSVISPVEMGGAKVSNYNIEYARKIDEPVQNIHSVKENSRLTVTCVKEKRVETTQIDEKLKEVQLNPNYTFENFVVGPSNRLAHAGSMAVCESVGKAYNPLFIYGSVGLGKTHLLQAICHTLLEKYPHLKVLYLSSEEFVNSFIRGLQKGELDIFRKKFRALDVLLVDDIHFLSGKEQSQEEFFHTFNALHNSSKQMVFSSDSEPSQIPELQQRIVSRFKWGLVAMLDKPHLETRIAILKQKAEAKGMDIPMDVLTYIAQNFTANIRELEGALNKIITDSIVNSRTIDLNTTKLALKEETNTQPTQISVSDVINTVCRYFNIKHSEIQSRKRNKSVSIPRHIAIYITRKLTNLSLEEIGRYYGGKDHATIVYSVEKISQEISSNPQMANLIEILVNEIKEKKY